jgi:hypothetical protein
MINAETFGRSFKCSLKVINEDDECIGDSVKVKHIKGTVSREAHALFTTSILAVSDIAQFYTSVFLAQKIVHIFCNFVTLFFKDEIRL